MSTAYLLLPLSAATLPDNSGSGNQAPAPKRRVSSGSQTSNTPKAAQLVWLFDAAVDEHLEWSFLLPGDYVSGGTIRLKFSMDAATSGNVVLKAGIAPVIDSSTDRRAIVFNAADVSSVTSVPGTLGQIKEVTIALTVTNLAANRAVTIFIGRDADHASDSATGDLVLEEATFEFTAP